MNKLLKKVLTSKKMRNVSKLATFLPVVTIAGEPWA